MTEAHTSHSPLVEIRNLQVYFPILAGIFRRKVGDIKAVDNVSLNIYPGETLGLVGESGCGKSTISRALLRLNHITGGMVRIKGQDITNADQREIRKLRPAMQMIFQDPQESLNPRMNVYSIISEPLREHLSLSSTERKERVFSLMDAVGLNRDSYSRFPHEFSGGQRQRIGIARALALSPELVICDEPIAALDVSIQAQVVNLLEDLQDDRNLTYLFISHDLGMVRHIATRVAVMYLGQIVELAAAEDIYSAPLHPYTEALLSAVPEADPQIERERQAIVLKGDVPSPANPPKGCNFCNRCPKALDMCFAVEPTLEEFSGRHVSCHLYTNPSGSGIESDM